LRSLAPFPFGLDIELDVCEKRDLDTDLQTELSLAKKVTDNLSEGAKIALHCGDEERTGKEGCTRRAEVERRT
jgi:hypothetical protein